MRRALTFAILFVLIFVVACTSRESAIREQEAVQVFTAMNDDLKYSETRFSGDDASAVADLVKAECPNGVGDSFVRATFEGKGASLVLYTTPDGKNVTCSVLKPKEQKQITIKKAAEAPSEETILTVNGQPITRAQAQRAVEQLPKGTQLDENTTTLLLNSLVNQELLRQEAAKMSVTDEELAQTREAYLAQANVTEDELAQRLQMQNLSATEFDKGVEEGAKLDKLLRTRLLLDELNVTEAAAREYYLANTNQFVQSEQAVARYIIISSNGRSIEQGQARAQQVIAKINTTDFCQLVTQYSDDDQSKENCGVYVVPRGVIDADLEYASFNTPVNQTAVVTTKGGIYFVQTLRVVPTQVMPYNEVAGNLQSSLRNAIAEQRLNLYLALLRNDAEIVSYLG